MKKYISYKKFVYVVISLSIIIVSGIFWLYLNFIHSNKIEDSIKKDTSIMTELIFQNLYTVMKSGGDKEYIDNTIKDLEKKIPHIKIDVIQNMKDMSNDAIKNSFITKKLEISKKGSDVQFITPILFKEECLICHKTSKIDDVAGVIIVEHSILDVKISFKEIIIMTIILLIILILVFFNTWFYFLKRYFIAPIDSLISQISKHQTFKDSETKILIDSKNKEIKFLEKVFNTKNEELFDSYNKLEVSSYTDTLTGIFNRKKFDEYSNLTLNNAKRNNIPFSIVMIDLNKFKPINDTYGHHIGDKILILFSQTIKETIRETDYFFRMGGDEFCLILNNTDMTGANIIINKLQKKLSNTNYVEKTIIINIYASFGISQYGIDGDTIGELIKIADNRMYENKRDSRKKETI